MARDIDSAFQQYGLHAYVPAPYHYAVVIAVCAIPFILVCSLLCFMNDEDESYEVQPAKVAPTSKAAPAKAKASPRREKLE